MVIVSNWIRYDLVDWVSKDRSQPYSEVKYAASKDGSPADLGLSSVGLITGVQLYLLSESPRSSSRIPASSAQFPVSDGWVECPAVNSILVSSSSIRYVDVGFLL